jgi:hypothetical protein
MEYIKNLRYFIRYYLDGLLFSDSKPTELKSLPTTNDIKLIPFPDLKKFQFAEKIPKDEENDTDGKLELFFQILKATSWISFYEDYEFESDMAGIKILKQFYPWTEHRPLNDIEYYIQHGAYVNTIDYIEDSYYVIDSLHMANYEMKPDTMVPALKCYMTKENGNLVISKFLYQDKEVCRKDEQFELCKRLLYVYLFTYSQIKEHLITTHTRVGQTFSYAMRKFVSNSNPLKQFLWNFCFSTLSVNKTNVPFLYDKDTFLFKFLPFTIDGLTKYTTDVFDKCIARSIVPTRDFDLESNGIREMNAYFHTYRKYIAKFYKTDDSEIQMVVDYLRSNVPEYRDMSPLNILASAVYVHSVLHEVKGTNVRDMVLNGYSAPTSLSKNGKPYKYFYLEMYHTFVITSRSLRKIGFTLPESFDQNVRESYQSMCEELQVKTKDFVELKFDDVESAVQS